MTKQHFRCLSVRLNASPLSGLLSGDIRRSEKPICLSVHARNPRTRDPYTRDLSARYCEIIPRPYQRHRRPILRLGNRPFLDHRVFSCRGVQIKKERELWKTWLKERCKGSGTDTPSLRRSLVLVLKTFPCDLVLGSSLSNVGVAWYNLLRCH